MVVLSLRDARTGHRVLPTRYSDNYLWLLPGESTDITVSWADARQSITPQLLVSGCNLAAQTPENMRNLAGDQSSWPIGGPWYLHDWCANGGQGVLTYQGAVEDRLGAGTSLDDFCRKAQFINYENIRAGAGTAGAGIRVVEHARGGLCHHASVPQPRVPGLKHRWGTGCPGNRGYLR